jgi:hypothetical protein
MKVSDIHHFISWLKDTNSKNPDLQVLKIPKGRTKKDIRLLAKAERRAHFFSTNPNAREEYN